VLRRILGPERWWQEDGEDCIMRSFITCTLQVKGDEFGGTCRMYGGVEKYI
jgi:hypothetical protein